MSLTPFGACKLYPPTKPAKAPIAKIGIFTTAHCIQRLRPGLGISLQLSVAVVFSSSLRAKPLDGLDDLVDIGVTLNLPLLL